MKEKDCIFCKIASGEIPSATVYEDPEFRVILDLSPATKGHALILPKNHYRDLCEMDVQAAGKIMPLAGRIGKAMKQSLKCDGFNVVQNNGPAAGQTVFHMHVHVIPRYENGPRIVAWEPGEESSETLNQLAEAIGQAVE